MITMTSTRNARHLAAHLLLGIALAGGLGLGLVVAPTAHADTLPERLPLAVLGVHPDPYGGCSGGCGGAGRTALARHQRGATSARVHPDSGGRAGPGDPVPGAQQLGTAGARVHPDPSAGPWRVHLDPINPPWRAHRASVNKPGRMHPNPYHTACDFRACDPAARPSLSGRAQAQRLLIKRGHQGTQPMLNPQPLPPHGDDAIHPMLNPQPLPPHVGDGLGAA